MDENNLMQNITSFTLYAQKARLTLTGDGELLSAGMAGVAAVQFEFSSDWDGLQKTAVFTNGIRTVKVDETHWADGVCVIPAEVLAVPGKTVMAGVYGSNGLHLTLPTVWCVLGRVEPSPDLSGEPVNPGPALSALERRIQALELAAVTEETVSEWGFTKNALTQHQSLDALVPRAQQAAKTNSMTQAVGVDGTGKLWTLPAGQIRTLAATESSGIYTYYGADFDFTTVDEIMQMASEGAPIRLAVINTGDVYALSHMHGAQSTARMFFTGITWGTGMTMPAVDVFVLDNQLGIFRISSVDLSLLGNYTKPAGGIPATDLAAALQKNLPFYVHINWGTSSFICTETYADIYEAFIDDNRPIIAIMDGEYSGFLSHADQNEAVICFADVASGSRALYEFHLSSSDVLNVNVRNIGDADVPARETVSGSTASITAEDNHVYSCGEITSLTITDSAQNISFKVDFVSGSTATVINTPSGYKAPGGDLTAEANKEYELDVRNGKAVLTAFEAVSAGA